MYGVVRLTEQPLCSVQLIGVTHLEPMAKRPAVAARHVLHRQPIDDCRPALGYRESLRPDVDQEAQALRMDLCEAVPSRELEVVARRAGRDIETEGLAAPPQLLVDLARALLHLIEQFLLRGR